MKWPQKNLGDLAIVSSGDGAPQDASDFGNSGLPFVRAGSLSLLLEGRPESELELIPKAISSNRRMNIFPAKTVLFAKSGMSCTKGLVYQLKSPAHVVNHLAAIQCGNDLDSRFLLRWFEANSPARLIANEAYPSIKISDIRAEKIPLPPLPEQKRIAAILDKADSLRTKRRETIKQLDKLARAVFIEMFGDPIKNPKGWEIKPLGELGALDRGVSKHRPRNDPVLLGGKYPLIQTGDVAKSDGYIRSYSTTYSDFGLMQSKIWPSGTLCITIAANIASTGILTFDGCFPDSVVGFLSAEKGRVEFVQGLFWFLKDMLEKNAPQVAQKNINLHILRELPVPFPEVALQQQFASLISSIEQHKTRRQTQLTELNTLFTSLQARAFKGEL